MRRIPRHPVILISLLLGAACSSESSDENPDGADGGEPDAAGSPFARYEPEERVDVDNVANYGPEPTIELPEPPKSGFRLVVPPKTLGPSAEESGCVAWQYPEITHKNVYAARVYTSGGLHHSNMYGVSLAEGAPSPYPECTPGQSSVANQATKFASGDIMDVLFANSTQIAGGEGILFPEGMAFKIKTEGREVATSIHWLNPTPDEVTSEIVYDFYTMPDDQVETEIVPFVFDNQGFSVPAGMTGDVVTTCAVSNDTANIVSLMPHAHERTTEFVVDLLDAAGAETRIFEDIGFDSESDIEVYEDPIELTGFSTIRHRCTVENDLEQDIVYGFGVNEMCTLFGYLYPPEAQQLGIVLTPGSDCVALDIGMYR